MLIGHYKLYLNGVLVLGGGVEGEGPRTEQLTKCCEPPQKLRVRLGICKIDQFKPTSNFILLIVPRRYFCVLWWFLLFDVLVLKFCAVCAVCVFLCF